MRAVGTYVILESHVQPTCRPANISMLLLECESLIGCSCTAGTSPTSEPSESQLQQRQSTGQRQSLDMPPQSSTTQEPHRSQQQDPSSQATTSQATNQASAAQTPSAGNSIPPELRAITDYLKSKDRLKTQGLFVNSADSVMLWAMHQPPDGSGGEGGTGAQGGRSGAVASVREALDRGQPVCSASHNLSLMPHFET